MGMFITPADEPLVSPAPPDSAHAGEYYVARKINGISTYLQQDHSWGPCCHWFPNQQAALRALDAFMWNLARRRGDAET